MFFFSLFFFLSAAIVVLKNDSWLQNIAPGLTELGPSILQGVGAAKDATFEYLAHHLPAEPPKHIPIRR
jgi:hypothetical protein